MFSVITQSCKLIVSSEYFLSKPAVLFLSSQSKKKRKRKKEMVAKMTHNVDSGSYWVLRSSQSHSGSEEVIIFQMLDVSFWKVFNFANPNVLLIFPYYSRNSSTASLVIKEQIWLSHIHPLGARWACWFLFLTL